jgi:acyl-CoA thioesterase
MGTLTEAASLSPSNEGFAVDLDPAWEGWGPAGGYLAAIALRAAEHVVPAGHRPVTLNAQFLSRAESGAAEVHATIRKPGGASLVDVALWQSDRCFFQAQIWTTSRTAGPRRTGISMPDVPLPETLKTLESYFGQLGRPLVKFWSNLDCRPVEFGAPGGPPLQTDRLQRWYRFRDEGPSVTPFDLATRAAVLIDSNIWAAHWRNLGGEPDYAGPSLDLTLWFHDATGHTDWLLIDSVSPIAVDAVVHGTASVWSADGKLVATGGGNCLVVPLTSPSLPSSARDT